MSGTPSRRTDSERAAALSSAERPHLVEEERVGVMVSGILSGPVRRCDVDKEELP
jgi:hypothetical protein